MQNPRIPACPFDRSISWYKRLSRFSRSVIYAFIQNDIQYIEEDTSVADNVVLDRSEDCNFLDDDVDPFQLEIALYSNEQYIVRSKVDANGMEHFNDPLSWWKLHEDKYPNLAKLAKKYLAIPATSTPVERLFSTASLVINEKRNRLGSDTAEDLIFLCENSDLLTEIHL